MLSYDDTFEYKLLAAKKGDRTALVRLGLTYFRNRIMPPDIQATERLLRDAANTGDADAQCSLGLFCHFGIGMDRNESEAVKWFQKASAQGHADAQHRLGCAFDRLIGFGVSPDDAEAVKWFRKAANQGHAQAQYDLARHLLYGRGVAKDATEAVRLCRKLAEQGHAAAQCMMSRCYATGDGVAMNPAEAEKWRHKAADQGHPYAKETLANVVAGRPPTGERGDTLPLILTFGAAFVGWLIYRLLMRP